jgi:hypothetical protein
MVQIPPGTCHTPWKFFNINSIQVYMIGEDLSMVNMGLYLNGVHLGSTSHMLAFSSSPFPQALPHTSILSTLHFTMVSLPMFGIY